MSKEEFQIAEDQLKIFRVLAKLHGCLLEPSCTAGPWKNREGREVGPHGEWPSDRLFRIRELIVIPCKNHIWCYEQAVKRGDGWTEIV